jgi:pimeloyl-ACP methyl ester carboxylesterase
MKNLASISMILMSVVGPAHAAQKPTIALVHGAFEDAGVWKGVAADLKKDGYHTIVIDLPGRPSNPLPADKVTLDLYRDVVIQAISHEHAPVVLVGHSFGGIVISAVGEAEPESVKTLVYLAAILPQDGTSLLGAAQQDAGSKVGPNLHIDKEKGIASIQFEARADLFANDGSAALRKALPALVVDEPLAPLATPVHVTAQRFGSIDKVYIETGKDHVISPGAQEAMIAATPVRSHVTLNTGHTPFFTDTAGLVRALEAGAK